MKRFIYILSFALGCSLNGNLLAYDNIIVHPSITAESIEQSETVEYLKNYLNLNLNLDEDIPSLLLRLRKEPLTQYIIKGTTEEDIFPRPRNHFYEPSTGKGLLNVFGNSLQKANEILEQTETDYFGYLTLSNNSIREDKLKSLLFSLGRIIHLIQDCAVPAHVRNDSHFYTDYEWINKIYSDQDPYERDTLSWCEKGQLIYTGYEPVEDTIFDQVSKYWDWNKGDKEKTYDNDSKGLAEFTNYNFVSKDTIYSDEYNSLSDRILLNGAEETKTVRLADGTTRPVKFRYAGWRIVDNYRTDKSEDSNYMVVYSFYDFYTKEINDKRVFSLNPEVLQEQARFLVPRAVGYSAGFLNYFFRGTISVTSQPIVDNSQVTGYDLTITNTSGFAFSDGEIKILTDTIDGTRRCIATVPISSLPDGEPILNPITITRSNDPRPGTNPQNDFTLYLDEKLTGTVLFKGKIGEEEGIAALVCPLVNVVPIMQAIDERRKFSPPEYADDDGDWYVYKRDGSSELITEGYGLNVYDDGEINGQLIIDMRNAIETLKGRYWDEAKKQPWHFTGSNLYETAHQGAYDEWEKGVNDLQDDKITLKEMQEVEKCILFLDQAYQPIRYTDWVPGSNSTMTNALKKAGAEAQGYTWDEAKLGAEENTQTAPLTYNSLHVCAIEGYGVKTIEDQGEEGDVTIYLAGLQYARAYGKVDTSGIQTLSELRDDKDVRIMLRARGNDTNMTGLTYRYSIYGSIWPRLDYNAWGLSGAGNLVDWNFSGTGGEDVEKFFLIIADFSSVASYIQFGGYTYLMITPEETLNMGAPLDSKSFYQDIIFAENAAAVWSVFLYYPDVEWYEKP